MYVIITKDAEVLALARQKGCNIATASDNSTVSICDSMESKISKFLIDMKIPPHVNGFIYLKTLFMKCMETPGFERKQFVDEVYEYIASVHGTTASRVERSIRHATMKAHEEYEKKPFLLYENVFGNIYERPVNSAFVRATVNYFKLNHTNN